MTNDAFGELYIKLYPDMVKVACKSLHVMEDAEDLVQEVFCALLSTGKVPVLDEAKNIRAYVFCRLIWGIQKRLYYMGTHAELIQPLPDDEALADEYNPYENPLAVLVDEDRRADVDQALERLPGPQRAVIESVVYTGRDFIETGKALWPGLEPFVRRQKASQLFRAGVDSLIRLLQEYHTTGSS